MERTVTISLAEYEWLRDRAASLREERDTYAQHMEDLQAQLSQIRDIVAPAEESEDSSEPESGVTISGVWFDPANMNQGASGDLANALLFYSGGSH